MFVPLTLLVQKESTLFTPEDLILALDRWVLPNYKTFTTSNPAMTKLECMGVLNSFHQAGKFHLSLKPAEVEAAVDAFMEDRLWVAKDTLSTLILLPNQRPEAWMAKPTFFRIFFGAIPKVLYEAATVIVNLIQAFGTYTYHSFKKVRTFTIPKSPNERKVATPISLVKKDS